MENQSLKQQSTAGISLKGIFSLALVKKEAFHGSYRGMRFRLCRAEDELQAWIYPEPYSWDATPGEQKEGRNFPLTEEGIEEAVAWMNEKYLTDFLMKKNEFIFDISKEV